MLHKRLHANNRIMTPIICAVCLPERQTGGQHRAVEVRSKLHKTPEECVLTYRHGNSLNHCRFRVSFDAAGHIQHAVSRHNTVCIQHQHRFVLTAPALTKISDVTYLTAPVIFAAAIKNLLALFAKTGNKTLPGFQLRFGFRLILCIAQHIKIVFVSVRGIKNGFNAGFEANDNAVSIFVVHRHDDSVALGDGRLIFRGFQFPAE